MYSNNICFGIITNKPVSENNINNARPVYGKSEGSAPSGACSQKYVCCSDRMLRQKPNKIFKALLARTPSNRAIRARRQWLYKNRSKKLTLFNIALNKYFIRLHNLEIKDQYEHFPSECRTDIDNAYAELKNNIFQMDLDSIKFYRPIFCNVKHLTPTFYDRDFSIGHRINKDLTRAHHRQRNLHHSIRLTNHTYKTALASFSISVIAGSIMLAYSAFAVPVTAAAVTAMFLSGALAITTLIAERIQINKLEKNLNYQNQLLICIAGDKTAISNEQTAPTLN